MAPRTPLAAVVAATAARDRTQTAWREAILAAKTAGVPVVEIAAAAGVTRERVYQIEREEAGQ